MGLRVRGALLLMKFVDEVRIHVKAGDGGDGAVALRREKFIPRGGPAGGDGGNGGNVVLVVDPQLSTLLDYRYLREHKARSGGHGMGSDMNGVDGEDLVLRVPPGTLVKDAGSGEVLADLGEPDQRFVVAKGGRGGLGNMHFATSTNQAPRYAQEGTPGEERELQLELKLLADVGIVGYPNAGKSTLIAGSPARGRRSRTTRSRRSSRTSGSSPGAASGASSSPTSPGSSRALTTGPGSATSSCATSSAARCSFTSSTARTPSRGVRPRRISTQSTASSRSTRRCSRRSRRSWR